MKHSRYIFSEPISRAEALRRMAAAVTVGALGLSGCNPTPSATPVTVGAAEGKVSRRRNPRNGDEVSMLGFGCMRFPTVGGDRYTGDIDRAPTRQMLEYAYECGVNYFDTAWMYHKGTSEQMVGEVLKQY
ncbi:MAG: aldo/keto reductase, partial [Alistipes sp.]|nr:aldo/keto reductase [Alistipes sp.]